MIRLEDTSHIKKQLNLIEENWREVKNIPQILQRGTGSDLHMSLYVFCLFESTMIFDSAKEHMQ